MGRAVGRLTAHPTDWPPIQPAAGPDSAQWLATTRLESVPSLPCGGVVVLITAALLVALVVALRPAAKARKHKSRGPTTRSSARYPPSGWPSRQ